MAPKVVDVDPDGTDSETDSKPSDHQIPSAPALDESNTSESKTSDVAATPPTDTTENIPQKEEVASAHEVSSTDPMLDEQERTTSTDDDVHEETPLKSCTKQY